MVSSEKLRSFVSDRELGVTREVDLLKEFVEGEEAITGERIKEFVAGLVEKYTAAQEKTPGRVFLIIDSLADWRLKQLLISSDDDRKKEIGSPITKGIIDSLRKRVLFELAGKIDRADFALAASSLLGNSVKTMLKMYGGEEMVLRQHNFWGSPERGRSHAEAVKIYAGIPENPNLLPIEMYEEADDDSQRMIVKKKDFDNLEDLIKKFDPEKHEYVVGISLKDFLSALLGAARGVGELSKRGLVMTDICLENIGWDAKKKNGFLFDLDSLNVLGARIVRSAQKKYILPEDRGRSPSQLYTDEMVYQLGVCLAESLSSFGDQMGQLLKLNIKMLAQMMMTENQPDRPTIGRVVRELGLLVAEIQDK